MTYVPHTPEEVEAMLARIGVAEVGDLFASIPRELRASASLKLPPALSEPSLLRYMEALAERNLPASRAASFLGAGAYHHWIPAAVDALAARSEFSTAYTPYQGEISQGTLQAIYEFQTLVCQLVGMEVSNASLYDGASSVAESALMAMRVTRGRQRILASAGLHPSYRRVLETYTQGLEAEIEWLPLAADGRTQPPASVEEAACVIVQSPNFLGCIEDLRPFSRAAHEQGALLVAATSEPLSLALLQPPGALGADIACGELQSFGVPLSFGGPGVGFMATRRTLVRQLPGRLVGETLDASGQRAFVLTLTTREQHIRRARATSNICTNQGLMALRATIYLALLGRTGLRRLALANLSLAHHAQRRLTDAGLTREQRAPFFNEFVVRVPDLARRLERLEGEAVLGGLDLERVDADRRDQLLVCVTEMNRREDVERLVRGLTA
ncbi:MAG: aminomethyl-transferring glycine dehydrogenase subunit GcvPA [Myxococcota bacterium]